ncbi:MAG: hypothetical protein NZM35_12360, partial [Chitinophagales bacterium]|nr:hypothetical protein [Chitinophagales bacterium]MDW8420210.1 hypothetical protein [Chitinophagales bacterium]
ELPMDFQGQPQDFSVLYDWYGDINTLYRIGEWVAPSANSQYSVLQDYAVDEVFCVAGFLYACVTPH